MNLSSTAQATLLLASYFSKASNEDAKPLTNVEWGRFALWLKEEGISPAELLVANPKPLLNCWHDKRIGVDRILQLLNRGHSLALAVEKWERAGLWVVTRSDSDYPKRLKQRLKTDSPPILFGCGSKSLLNAEALAVIGSRNANASDLEFTCKVGKLAAANNIAVVSGGARGVDETAMLGSIDSGGFVIGILADSLLRAATSKKWRQGLMNGNTVLVSPFYPEAGFNTGNAMARNKYIYCMSGTSLVIHSGIKGGTLNGAMENLKKGWVPLWVKPTNDKEAANASLVEQGGQWCKANIDELEMVELFDSSQHVENMVKEDQVDLFSTGSNNKIKSLKERVEPDNSKSRLTSEIVAEADIKPLLEVEQAQLSAHPEDGSSPNPVDFYNIFVQELRKTALEPVSLEELMKKTSLHKTQIDVWLSRAVEEGVAKKLTRPVRYLWVDES